MGAANNINQFKFWIKHEINIYQISASIPFTSFGWYLRIEPRNSNRIFLRKKARKQRSYQLISTATIFSIVCFIASTIVEIKTRPIEFILTILQWGRQTVNIMIQQIYGYHRFPDRFSRTTTCERSFRIFINWLHRAVETCDSIKVINGFIQSFKQKRSLRLRSIFISSD